MITNSYLFEKLRPFKYFESQFQNNVIKQNQECYPDIAFSNNYENLTNLNKEAETRSEKQLFQHLISQIYNSKLKLNQLEELQKGKIPRVTFTTIELTIRTVLQNICQKHKKLMNSQIRGVLEQQAASCYFKIDSSLPGCGFYGLNVDQEVFSGIQLSIQPSQQLNKCSYDFVAWTIYHHYFSISQCNKQVARLIQIIRQCSEGIFNFYKDSQIKNLFLNAEFYQNKKKPFNQFKQFTRQGNSLINQQSNENFQLTKIYQLNLLTIKNLIPLSLQQLELTDEFQLDQIFQQSTTPQIFSLYKLGSRFQISIRQILKRSQQEIPKYIGCLQQFKSALKMLRSRYVKNKELQIRKNTIKRNLFSLKQPKDSRRQLYNQLQAEQNFNTKQYKIQYKKEARVQKRDLKSQLALMIKNQCKLRQEISKSAIQQQNQHEIQAIEKIVNLIDRKYVILPKTIIQNENLDKIVQIEAQSAQLFQSNINQNTKSISKSSETKKLKRQIEELKKKYFLRSDKNFVLTKDNISIINKNIEQNKKNVTITMKTQSISKEGTKLIRRQQSTFSMISDQLGKCQELAFKNFQKRKNESCRLRRFQSEQNQYKNILYYSKPESQQLNLHEFLEKNQFKYEKQQSEGDEHYLQRLQKQNQQKQNKKKKKKKNKRKKNKEQAGVEQKNENESETEPDKVVIPEKNKNQIKTEFSLKQEQLIRKIEEMKINQQNRAQCFNIQERNIYEMLRRQQQIFDKSIVQNCNDKKKQKQQNKKKI